MAGINRNRIAVPLSGETILSTTAARSAPARGGTATACFLPWLAIVGLACLALAGCSPEASIREALAAMAPDEDETLALDCITALRTRDFSRLESLFDPAVLTPAATKNFEPMAAMFGTGDPVQTELVGCNVVVRPSQPRRSHLTYQLAFESAWVLVAVVIDRTDAAARVAGLHVTPLSKPLQEIHALTFEGKSLKHFGFLAALLAIPLFILVALIVCIRTPLRRLKWLWILFILFGVGKISLNWTTGAIAFNPLMISVQLFGAGIVKSGLYAPWMLEVSLPLGAILFLIWRRKLRRAVPPVMPPPIPAAPPPV